MIKEIKYLDCYKIEGRGFVYSVDLVSNGLPRLRTEWKTKLMNTSVRIGQNNYLVKGIEAFAAGDSYKHSTIGLLVLGEHDWITPTENFNEEYIHGQWYFITEIKEEGEIYVRMISNDPIIDPHQGGVFMWEKDRKYKTF